MSQEKLNRRKKMGDDPTAVAKSNSSEAGMIPPQPIPGAPQGKGNMMNNPEVGKSMGGGMAQAGSMSGTNLYPYGDGGIPMTDGRMGAVGFTGNSGTPQNFVSGRGYNQQPYNSVQQPKSNTMEMLEPMHLAKQAGDRAAKLYGEGQMPSYQVGPIGMMGTPIENQLGGQVNPGQIPSTQTSQMFDTLGLQGMPDAQAAAGPQMGMNTGAGGGRNQPKPA